MIPLTTERKTAVYYRPNNYGSTYKPAEVVRCYTAPDPESVRIRFNGQEAIVKPSELYLPDDYEKQVLLHDNGNIIEHWKSGLQVYSEIAELVYKTPEQVSRVIQSAIKHKLVKPKAAATPKPPRKRASSNPTIESLVMAHRYLCVTGAAAISAEDRNTLELIALVVLPESSPVRLDASTNEADYDDATKLLAAKIQEFYAA